VTPSDSVAIIAANAVGAIPYFEGGLKGVARYVFILDNYGTCLSPVIWCYYGEGLWKS
jgi:hypothetical protein